MAKLNLQPNKCWVWRHKSLREGYGQVRFGRSQNFSVHRVSYTLFKGRIDKGKSVLHICDNRRCFNPNHLFLGTQKDNIHDAIKKGRNTRGEKQWSAKITGKEVKEIREIASCGAPHREIAKAFGLSQANVSRIVSKKLWKHIK